MFCNQCGEQNPIDANFCKKCGAPMAKQADTQPLIPSQVSPDVQLAAPSAPLLATAQPAAPPGNSGFSIASLVLGIVGLTPYLQICSILAIIFGALGINQANKKGYGGKSMSLAGLILGIAGIVVWIAVLALIIAFSVSYGDEMMNIRRISEDYYHLL
jgi:hypothetical protein